MRGIVGAVVGAAPISSGVSSIKIVLNTIRLLLQLAEDRRELGGNEMRVEAAGIGQHPHDRIADLLLLPANFRVRFVERRPIGSDAEDGDDLRAIFLDL